MRENRDLARKTRMARWIATLADRFVKSSDNPTLHHELRPHHSANETRSPAEEISAIARTATCGTLRDATPEARREQSRSQSGVEGHEDATAKRGRSSWQRSSEANPRRREKGDSGVEAVRKACFLLRVPFFLLI